MTKESGVSAVRKYNALLRFYFKMEPPTDEAEWLERVEELIFALDFDGKFRSTNGQLNV